MRTHLGWKQFALADEAGVTPRTIERVEAGERVSEETLNKIEKALKFGEGALKKASYWPSDEELAAIVKKTKEDYTHTSLNDLSGACDLQNILSASAYLVDGTAAADELAESIAAVKDYTFRTVEIYTATFPTPSSSPTAGSCWE